jgi:hypothetical protein
MVLVVGELSGPLLYLVVLFRSLVTLIDPA